MDSARHGLAVCGFRVEAPCSNSLQRRTIKALNARGAQHIEAALPPQLIQAHLQQNNPLLIPAARLGRITRLTRRLTKTRFATEHFSHSA